MANLLPQDNYDSFLTASIGSADTTIYVNALPTKTAGFLTLYETDGRTVREKIKYAGISSNPNRLTGCTRGLAFVDTAGVVSDSAVPANQLSHPANVRIAMTDNIHYLARALSQLNGDEETGGVMQNPAVRTINSNRDLIDKEYADSLTASTLPALLVTQNGADPSLTINVGAGSIMVGQTVINYAGAAAQAVSASQTNYVQLNESGSLVINTSSFVAGNIPLAEVVANGTDITSITDRRPILNLPYTDSINDALVGTQGTPSSSNKYVTDQDPRFALLATGIISMFGGNTAPTGWLLCDGTAVSRATYATLFALLFPTVGTFTITLASPGVVTLSSHGLATGDGVYLTTTGALPTGLSANTRYWVIRLDANTFSLATSLANALAGTGINTSVSQSGVHTCVLAPYGIGDGSTTFNTPNLKQRLPIGKDQTDSDFAGLGQTGGAQTVTLTTTELPAHTHTLSGREPVSGSGQSHAQRTTASSGNDAAVSTTTGSSGTGSAFSILNPYLAINFIIKT